MRLINPDQTVTVVTKDIRRRAMQEMIPEYAAQVIAAEEAEKLKKSSRFYDKEGNKYLHPFVPALEYCDWLPEATEQERIVKKNCQSCYPNCCFNHRVGLPRLTYKNELGEITGVSDPIPLSRYEKEMIDHYEENDYYAQVKCRGSGASETITVRHMAFKYVTNIIPRRKCLISAGTSRSISATFTGRIKAIYDTIPFVYKVPPNSEKPESIYVAQGEIHALASAEDAFRAYENVGDVLLEESGFWDLTDDEPVLAAAEPHAFKSDAKIGAISTPNGQRGFFWTKIFSENANTKYYKHVVNWRRVVGIPEESLEEIKKIMHLPLIEIRKIYKRKYDTDIKYREWFARFFGVSFEEFFDIAARIISAEKIIELAEKDFATYQQEADNQFLLEQDSVFGKFDTTQGVKVETW